MTDKEFQRILKLDIALRDALRAVARVRKRYPAGVQKFLSQSQYLQMKKIEDEITKLTDAPLT